MPFSNRSPVPACAGVGLRHRHLQQIADEKPAIPWLEVHAENFFAEGGVAVATLERIRQDYPLSVHGVGLSLGTTDDLDIGHLKKLKSVVERFQPSLVSEHLSWGAVHGQHFNDLLPVPYTEESLDNFCRKVRQTQDYLGCQILIENPSSYLEYRESDIPEWEFYASLPARTGCGLLLDVNNFFVNSHNHGFSREVYIETVNPDDVGEIHVAGHAVRSFEEGVILIDDHGSEVCDDVWGLFARTVARLGRKPVLVEWDTDVPDLSVLLNEAAYAENVMQNYVAKSA